MPTLGDNLSLRFVMTVVGFIAGLGGAWLVTEGNLDLGGAVFMAVLLVIPYLVYVLAIRTRGASIGAGIVLRASIIGIHLIVWLGRESSTSAVAYLLIPFAGTIAVVIAVIWERIRAKGQPEPSS